MIAVVEENVNDENHALLRQNLQQLKQMRLLNGKQLNIVELPMPDELYYEDQHLVLTPIFYIANHAVIVPTFRSKNDDKALRVIHSVFPAGEVVGIDSTEIIWGAWQLSLP